LQEAPLHEQVAKLLFEEEHFKLAKKKVSNVDYETQQSQVLFVELELSHPQ
jgi:hypothetical protein